VISGYLITGILVREVDASATIDLLNFYGRRARRLLPAMFLAIVITLVAAAALAYSPFELIKFSKSAAAASAYVSNVWFMAQLFDYFSPESAQNPLLHTWSLAVEEQFYIAWPLLILVVAKWRRSALFPIIAALTVASLILCVWISVVWQPAAFYSPVTRAWEFGLGALVRERFTVRQARGRELLGFSGLALCVGSALMLSESAPFPSWTALFPALGAAAMLVAGEGESRFKALLAVRPAVWLGRHSYSIYLYHWPLIVLAQFAFGDGALVSVSCICLVVVLAAVSYRWVEQPIRHSTWLTRGRARSTIAGLGISAASVAVAAVAAGVAFQQTDSARQRAVQLATTQVSRLAADNRKCLISLSKTEPKLCDYPPGGSSPDGPVLLIGDSHAAQWFTTLEELARQRGVGLVTLLKSSCAVADVKTYSFRLRREFIECYRWRDAVEREVTRLRPSLIVVAQNAYGYVKNEATAPIPTQVNTREEWAVGLRRSVESLAKTARVLVLSDTPQVGFDVPVCLSRRRAAELSDDCGRAEAVVVDRALLGAESVIQTSDGRVSFIDVTDLFCRDGYCPSVIGQKIVYRDTNHVSEEFVQEVSGEVIRRMMSAASVPPSGSAPVP
jgi:peptidoglycan/LPS O-acetylase OafA/YrhL